MSHRFNFRFHKAHWEHVASDLLMLAMAFYLAYFIRFDAMIPLTEIERMVSVLPIVVGGHLLVNYLSGVYRHLWRYIALTDLLDIVKSSLVVVVIFFLFDKLVYQADLHFIPYGVIAIYFFLAVFFLFGARLLRRSLAKLNHKQSGHIRRKTLIIGAGDAGQMVINELQQNKMAKNLPIAYLDDDPKKLGKVIQGVQVKGKISDLSRIAEEEEIEEIIIAMPSASKNRLREIVQQCGRLGIPSKIVPSYQEIIESSSISLNKIREVDIEDLLGREPATLDIPSIANYLSDAIILITGAGGSIGSELCRQIARFHPRKLILLGHGENSIYQIDLELKEKQVSYEVVPIIADIKDRHRLERIFSLYKPDIVFHAAAHKHVPLMESNPEEAVMNNVIGTKNAAELAEQYGARSFVLVSTDKAVNPTNVMGATKRVAELIIQNLSERSKTKFSAVRFGNVLGSRGSVIPLFKKQIEMGGPITVTHPDAMRYFMTIPEACQLIIQSGAIAGGGEIFILDMGEPIKIVDMAKALIRLSGFEESEIEIKFVGLRPGEKLKEELLTTEEGTSTTRIEKVFVAKPNSIDSKVLMEQITALTIAAERGDRQQMLAQLQQLVPTYRPS